MSPLQKDPTKADAIIRAAIHIFARDGLEKGKIADIAKEAGIGKGTVYEYYSSKDEIFHAMVNTIMADMVDASETLYSMDLSPRDKLRTFMRMNTEIVFEMDEAMLIITEMWAQGARAMRRGEHEAAQFFDSYGKMKQFVINILKAGVMAEDFREMNYDGVATLALAFVDGFIWQFMLNNDRAAFDRALVEGIDSFMKGLER
ncbi:MAG: TetR/AcrR family transcriptional regulator [Candidatus Marinimicrobia bacterium]|jgi:TetR/AcrR family fatty acid metabolism transcriptional regulator|nr:TetR/AcrR family transcriptional regulator [Candidatus Neomarinimicrobiota bacterium]MBT3631117.1 TetR/AcrR family transcriptional regulator [Candidatus Neomarinimicrobiota bacterium]MBT3825757.1 TetR/AcrR family transcriptional regulator [Candidatus Neomarinimicrobiota bacterium]MBT4130499.1 TetR/AcrR family transcriptional regulator [Candidatus Neomarinimicrobiota bacterium]MBT4297076.1 TetR/AcrR family transcriptional regulator [Candidatus Neomarinimicrobiota bacterium]